MGYAIVAAGAGWVIQGRRRVKSFAFTPGSAISVRCTLKLPSQQRPRWRRGRLALGGPTVVWEPASRRHAAVVLYTDPGGPEPTVRTASPRDWWRVNPGAKVVECASAEGPALVAVMPHEVPAVLRALGRAGGG